MLKRSIDDEEEGRELIEVTAAIAGKKMRSEYGSGYQMVAHHGEASQDLVAAGRTSSLPAPEITLLGHDNAIYSIAFSPNGEQLCSGSLDRQIFLWNVFGDCKNYNVLRGHKGAVLQVLWPTDLCVVSCSADKSVACWDPNKGVRTRKLLEHTAIVNSCAVAADAPHLVASGSDDCTVILWDVRSKQSITTIYHDYQVCAVCISSDGSQVYSAGIDNIIRRFDNRRGDVDTPDLLFEGHSDTVTGLSLSPDGQQLLSNGMDSQLRCWDTRPFVVNKKSRCTHVMGGIHHGAEKLLLRCSWSPDREKITAGSADRMVHIWETSQFQQLPSWPGHKASVNEVIFHPKQSIIASCSSDKSIIIGELPSNFT